MKLHYFSTYAKVLYPNALFLLLTMIMYSVSPLLKRDFSHVFPSMYLFKFEPGGLVHWIFYYFEVLSALSLSCVNTGVDCCFVLYALQMCSELSILTSRFVELSVGRDYVVKLKDCVRRHYLLGQAKYRLEDIYGIISIWLALSSALVLCSLMFQVTEVLFYQNHKK